MDLGIAGRTALVGGASSGLGRASAAALAAEGCRLAIWSRGGAGLEAVATDLRERYGTEVTVLTGDAAVEGTAARIAAEATEALGTIDILVLNAGGPPPVDPTATERAGWERAFQLLSITPIELATELLPGDACAPLGPGRRDPVVGRPPADPGPGLLERRPGRPHGLAQDDRPGRGGRRRDGQRGHARAPPDTRGSTASTAGGPSKTGETLEAVRAAHLATIPAGRYGRPEELGRVRGLPVLRRSPATRPGTFTAIDGGLIAGLP